MFWPNHHRQTLIIIIAALLASVASGMLIGYIEDGFWWIAGIIVSPIVSAIFFIKYQNYTTNGSHRSGRNIFLPVSFVCMSLLAWVATQRRNLIGFDISTIALVTIVFSLVSIWLVYFLLRLPVLSFPIIFLGVTFMFTSSSLILYQQEGITAFQYWRLVDLKYVIQGMPLVMLAFSSFLTGALCAISAGGGRDSPKERRVIRPAAGHTLRQVGLGLYILSMLIVIVISLRGGGLSYAYEGGYGGYTGARKTGSFPLLIPIAFRVLPWSMLILIGTSNTRQLYIRTWLIAIPAFVIMFLSGDRTAPLGLLLLMASSSYLLGFSIDWKRTLLVIVLAALLVSTIANLRQTPIKDWSVELVVAAATNQVEGRRQYDRSPLSGTLIAMSTSYQTLMGTLMLVPDRDSHRYGMDYLRSIAMTMPFSASLYPYLGINVAVGKPSEWIRDFLDPGSATGTGYLQIAEAYLQFGIAGIVGLYLLLGILLPRLWWYLQSSDIDSQKLSLALIVMLAVFTWVRNDSIGLVRELVWGWFFVYGIPYILSRLRLKKATEITMAPQSQMNGLGREVFR